MKSYRKELQLEVPTRRAFINITSHVKECLRESGVREGLALVNSMHVTAGVFIDDDETGLYHHYEVWLERLAPVVAINPSDEDIIGEDIIDAHMKRHLMGREVVIAVTEGQLDFGHWENIFYGEFDGGRKKRVLVKIIGE
ncbi:secondary thiamine-phosphate synthase enzyme YjbQ [soil metagenome]